MTTGPDQSANEERPGTRGIDLAREPGFRLGDVAVDPTTCTLAAASSELRLEPRVMQVLIALARADGRALSRDDMIEQCWSGRVVSEDAIHRCIASLRKGAAAFEPPPYTIETIPRVGYRLHADVVHDTGSHDAASEAVGRRVVAMRAAAVFGVAVALLAAYTWIVRPMPDAEPPVAGAERLSLGVAPFANVSTGGDHGPFVDGLTEELISKLGAIEGLNVPGRASSFQIRDRQLSAQEIGQVLNVRYVVEGAVLREGDTVRITVQLTDAASGYQVWSRVFDRSTGTLLATQAEIAREVIASIPALIGVTEPKDTQSYIDARAHEHFLRGLGFLRARYFDGGWPDAHVAFTDAVAADPDYAEANAYLAISIAELRPANAEHRAREALSVAIMNAPGSAPVLFAQGWIAAAFGVGGQGPDLGTARHFLDRSLALDPTNSEALRARARYEDDPVRKLALLRQVTEMDPLFYAARLDLASELANRGLAAEAYREFDMLMSIAPGRGVRGAIELARAGTDLDMLGRYAFSGIQADIVVRPDRLLIAGLLTDFGAIQEARFLYAYPTPDPLLFLPKRREVYLAWLDGDAARAFEQVRDADFSGIEGSSVFGAAVALFAQRPEDAIALVLAAYPDMPTWTDERFAAVRSYPEVIGAHIYGMALRERGDPAGSRRVLLALVPSIHRLNPGELAAQRRYLGLAVLYAQAGEVDRALEELRKARAAGWRYPHTYAWINYAPSPAIDATNGYLSPLADHPEFESMMQDIRTENAAALARFEESYGVLSRLRALMALQEPAGSNP